MSRSPSRKKATSGHTKTAIASFITIAALPPLAVAAEQAPAQQQDHLPTIHLKASKHNDASYVAPKAQSSKYTAPLVETPKTITVLTEQNLKDQNLLSLRDALSTTAGITFGAGEGGGGYGDKITMRGFDSTYNTTIDGLRDSALTSRSDIFNIEAIEVIKGSDSSRSGIGAVGGGVNLVSKTAKGRDFNEVSVGVGTDDYYRVTGDFNKRLSDTVAARINVMGHRNDVPGRDVEQKERWGIAPTITFGLGTDTRTTISYIHQTDNNTPQYGVPYYNGRAVPGISSEKYYGYSNFDDQDISTDYLTLKIDSDISDAVKLNSITRVGQVTQDTTVSAPQGTYCLADGTAPTGITDTPTRDKDGKITTPAYPTGYKSCTAPGEYSPSGPRGLVRNSTNKVYSTDNSVTWNFNTGSIKHALVTGFNITHEDYDLEAGGYLYNADGTASTRPNMNVYNPSHIYVGPVNYFKTADTTGKQDTRSVYVFDTIGLNRMLDLNLGVRYDHVEGSTQTDNYTEIVKVAGKDVTYARPYLPKPTADSPTSGRGAVLKNSDDMMSYNAALVFKPVDNSSIYLSYSNAKTPSKASVNGSCSDSNIKDQTTGLFPNSKNCNVDPESAETYELGTKWQFNDNLLLTGAIFRTERTNYKVSDVGNPDNVSGYQVLDGSSRVDGIELGVAGKILPQWNISANVAYLDSEVLQGASDYVASQSGDYSKGDKLTFVPELSGSLWTTYDINRHWQVGYGFTYMGEQYVSQHSVTAQNVPQLKSEAYFVHNASVTFKANRNLSFQLNVKNLFDEEYYTAIRNNGWATPGEGVNGVLSVNYKF